MNLIKQVNNELQDVHGKISDCLNHVIMTLTEDYITKSLDQLLKHENIIAATRTGYPESLSIDYFDVIGYLDIDEKYFTILIMFSMFHTIKPAIRHSYRGTADALLQPDGSVVYRDVELVRCEDDDEDEEDFDDESDK